MAELSQQVGTSSGKEPQQWSPSPPSSFKPSFWQMSERQSHSGPPKASQGSTVSHHRSSPTHLLLVLGFVNLLLEQLHALKGLPAVRAVDEDIAVSAGEAVPGQLGPISEPPGVVETHLLPDPPVSLNGAHVDVLLRLNHLRTWDKMRRKLVSGLRWWLSGKESTCQCRKFGFNP